MNEKVKRFFETIDRMNAGLEVKDEDLLFVFQYSPEINESAIEEYVAANKDGKATADQHRLAMIEWSKKIQSDPVLKERAIKLYADQQGQKTADKLANGIQLVLAGTDIANSVAQIQAGNKAAKQSRKPGRPAIPQRDQLLQQALRQAEQGTFDSERALAPTRAQIQDQYLNDIQNAKTASTGQAGAFGAYAQVAADRRNRASLNLAPMADQIKAREQQRYDNLLGMRLDETQNMFQNQAQLYPYDLNQYNQDQQAAASLGSTGRENLRYGLYNFGNQASQAVGRMSAERRIRNMQNQASSMFGDDLANKMIQTERRLMRYTNPNWKRNNPRDTYDSGFYNPNLTFS